MKISNETMNVFRNFATIFPAINVDEQRCLKVLSASENIIGCYDTEETFSEFAIYDLVQFLGMVSLFDLNKTDFEFIKDEEKDQDFVKIKAGKNMVKYIFTDKDLIPNVEKILPSKKYKGLDNFNAFIDITKEDFAKLNKAAQIMRVSNLNIKVKDDMGILTISDPSNPMSNDYKICVKGEGEGEININVEYLLMMAGDYRLSIQSNVLLKLAHKTMTSLIYFISASKIN